MKIAFIGQKGIPAKFGGVERHVEELATRMVQQGQEVFVYARKNYVQQGIAKYKGVNIIFIPSIPTKHLDAISHTFFSILHILFHKYDVVHFQSIGPSALSWVIKIFKSRVKLIATFHCQDYYHQKWGWFARKFLMLGEKITCTVPDTTIVVSKILQKYVKEKYNRSAVFIPNGSAIKINDNTNHISNWGLEPQKYILSVGRLIKHKNIHQLIDAFIMAKAEKKINDDYKLAIVGDGFHTDQYVEQLKNMTRGKSDIILTGNQTGETLEQLFTHAKLFIQPSSDEGLSLVILEALGYNLPLLVSNIPENLEATQGLGYSFKVNDVMDLKSKLIKILKNNSAEESLYKKQSTNITNTLFNWNIITSNTLNNYK